MVTTITGACKRDIRDTVFVRCAGVAGVVIGPLTLAALSPGWHARIISRSERPLSLRVRRSDRSARNAAELNLCRQCASGSQFLPRVHFLQESARSLTKSFGVLSFVLLHGNHHGGRKIGNARKVLGEFRNV